MAAARKRRRRWLWGSLVAMPVLLFGTWWAAHTFPWFGSTLADGLRAVIGTRGVTWLEEVAYGIEDSIHRATREGEAPKAYWEVPTTDWTAAAASGSGDADAKAPSRPPFVPDPVGPLHPKIAAPGDGEWVPIADPMVPHDPPRMAKTLIHPDASRPWAEVFVVAINREITRLHLVIGSAEPRATTPEGRDIDRPGVVPMTDRGRLLAGFNGGFKTEHGRWGIHVQGVDVVAPRGAGCTIARAPSGALRIAPWEELENEASSMDFWRQTPPCMILRGKRHGALWDPDAKGWGAALDGETVIRRSAIGLSSDRRILYMGVSNHTTAQNMANAMLHAGAHDVAQLDVNWSYPKFVLFPPDTTGTRITESLFEGFKVDPDEYLGAPSKRDFFYVTARDPLLEPQAL